jgi:hypothetical protein
LGTPRRSPAPSWHTSSSPQPGKKEKEGGLALWLESLRIEAGDGEGVAGERGPAVEARPGFEFFSGILESEKRGRLELRSSRVRSFLHFFGSITSLVTPLLLL